MSNSVYQIVTDRIIKKLQEGTIPWRKPWQSGDAVSWKTQKPYRGINTLLLDPGICDIPANPRVRRQG